MAEPVETRCARCGRELICRVVYGKARAFTVESDRSQRLVRSCPRCGASLVGVGLEELLEQANRVP